MDASGIATTLNSLGRMFETNPERGPATYAPAIATLASGLKCRIVGPAGEQVETDMPASMGGEGSAPNPGWLFRSSLAACCATMIASHAARLGVTLTELEVTVTGEGNHRGMLGLDETISAGHSALRTDVRIASPNARPEQLRELVRWANEHSPVGCTVHDGPTNALTIEVL